MQVTQKHIIALAGVIILVLLGYSIFERITLSQSDGVKISTGGNNAISQSSIATDTLKRLETVANSGTDWGISPFGSGKPMTEEPKLKFQKPNTEWKDRTITLSDGTVITHRFGQGNPAEVALPESEMKGCSWQEGGDYCTDKGAGYVDPLLEKLILDVLTSPDWEPLLENCENDFRIVDAFNQSASEVPIITYNRVINLRDYIAMEEIFIVNPQTGRKNITKEGYGKLMGLYGYITSASDSQNQGGLGDPLPGISKCVDTYGVNIANMLINIRGIPWRGSKDIPASQ